MYILMKFSSLRLSKYADDTAFLFFSKKPTSLIILFLSKFSRIYKYGFMIIIRSKIQENAIT